MSDAKSPRLILNHLSDLHIHVKAKNITTAQRLAELRKVNLADDAKYGRGNLMFNVFTGDNIDDGTPEQRKRLNNLLHRSVDLLARTSPYPGAINVLLPGNHDIAKYGNQIGTDTKSVSDAITAFYKLQMDYLTRHSKIIITQKNGVVDAETMVKLQQHTADSFINKWFWFIKKKVNSKLVRILFIKQFKVMIILLDSNPTNLAAFNFARGEIGKKQLGILRRYLNTSEYSDWYKVVALHHHPVYNNTFLKLEDADDFMAAIWETVDLVMCGHKHEYNIMHNNKSQKWNGLMSFAGSMATLNRLKYASFHIQLINGKHVVKLFEKEI